MRLPALIVAALVALAGQPRAETARDRLDAYLSAYLPQLSALVAVESLVQHVPSVRDSRNRVIAYGEQRRLRSEIAFVGLPGEGNMLGFRLVTRVDGKEIRGDDTTITDLLQRGSPADTRSQLLRRSAQHNLGSPRTTNLPTLPLELLQPSYRHRFTHRVSGRDRIAGKDVEILVATEVTRPTIVRQADGRDSPSIVSAWLDGEGRVLRAEVRLRLETPAAGDFEPTVRVDFTPDSTLNLLVPSRLRETFWSTSPRGRGTGDARYSEFRRFQTSGRIVPPPP